MRALFRASGSRQPVEAPPEAPIGWLEQRERDDAVNMRRLLAFTLRQDSCCVDVGAHRGAVLADMVRLAPHGRHVAFEPIPELCAQLRREFPDVDCRQSALSSRNGTATFAHVLGPAEGWSGLVFRPLPPGAEAEVEEIEVRLEALDEVLDPELRPAVIKIDVEGAEQQVIEGARTTLARHRPTLVFEHGSGSAEAYGTRPDDIFGLLDELGFRIFDLDGDGPYTRGHFEQTFYAARRVNFVAHP